MSKLLERVTGFEPVSPTWRAGILPAELHPLRYLLTGIAASRSLVLGACVKLLASRATDVCFAAWGEAR